MNTPVAGEIWHLSIDDLLATPVPSRPRLGGPGPFVINLSASTAPISQPPKALEACPTALVYQIQRIEDRRLRFRLRLGPFASEEEAEGVLDKVRDLYPSALTATADIEDTRAIESMRARLSASRKPERPAAAPAPSGHVAPMPVLSVPMAPIAPLPIPTLTQTALPPRATASAPSAPAPAPTAPVPPVPARSAPELAAAVPAAAVPSAPVPSARPPEPVARVPQPLAPRVEFAAAVAPPAPAPIESTQTVRPITPLELEGDEASRWFVIQLSIADRAFDPDDLPNLDIFSEYRLYCVAGLDQGRIMHALRLGFFGDAVSAGAVASYLAAYYESPTVKRVSTAERERFAEQRVQARKDIGATGRHAAIEITGERILKDPRGAAPSVLPCVIGPPTAQSAALRKR